MKLSFSALGSKKKQNYIHPVFNKNAHDNGGSGCRSIKASLTKPPCYRSDYIKKNSFLII